MTDSISISGAAPKASAAPFVFCSAPVLAPGVLPATTFDALASIVEKEASITELLYVAAQCSRFVSKTPKELKGGALASFFSSIGSLFKRRPELPSDPQKARALIASKIRNLAAVADPEVPDGSVQIKQFNIALIPLIIEIIQLIMQMIEKFRAV